MYCVYVLLSKKNFKKYTGYTQKSPEQRLIEHNQGSNSWTRDNGPFDLLYHEFHTSRRVVLKREIYLKSAAGRKFLKEELSGRSLAGLKRRPVTAEIEGSNPFDRASSSP